jgi:hypothetical protein
VWPHQRLLHPRLYPLLEEAGAHGMASGTQIRPLVFKGGKLWGTVPHNFPPIAEAPQSAIKTQKHNPLSQGPIKVLRQAHVKYFSQKKLVVRGKKTFFRRFAYYVFWRFSGEVRKKLMILKNKSTYCSTSHVTFLFFSCHPLDSAERLQK